MKLLSKVRHRNLVGLVGFCEEPGMYKSSKNHYLENPVMHSFLILTSFSHGIISFYAMDRSRRVKNVGL